MQNQKIYMINQGIISFIMNIEIRSSIIPEENLICSICNLVILNPVICTNCEKLFCRKCFEQEKNVCKTIECQNTIKSINTPSIL